MKLIRDELNRVYIEKGRKKIFAGSIEWPGWCSLGEDEAGALQALFDVAPRYAAVIKAAQIDFQMPIAPASFSIVENLEGNFTTDFGAPNLSPASDDRPVTEPEYLRLQGILMACWQALDSAMIEANGRELRKNARGGGMDLYTMLEHVTASDASDLERLAWKFKHDNTAPLYEEMGRTRQAILNALFRAALQGIPEQGPRSGEIWSPRYFVRRLAWHTLDHAWEIEDRLVRKE